MPYFFKTVVLWAKNLLIVATQHGTITSHKASAHLDVDVMAACGASLHLHQQRLQLCCASL
jgi:hypothetical protein